MPSAKVKSVSDHKCPTSGNLHKIAVEVRGLEDLPKMGAVVEYDCPDCKETHQFEPVAWGVRDAPFPAKHYISGRIIPSNQD